MPCSLSESSAKDLSLETLELDDVGALEVFLPIRTLECSRDEPSSHSPKIIQG